MKHFIYSAALLISLAVSVTGCGSNTQPASLAITPAAQALSSGQTAQFTATGTIPHGKHPSTTQDVTSMVTWKSSSTDIATISASGMATGVSAGTVTITASMAGATSATATLAVSGTSGPSGGGGVVSLAIVPGTQSMAVPSQTTQFIAVGTTSNGATVDVTSQATWRSSSASVATISASGLATGIGKGTTTISAVFTNSDKTAATGTAALTVIAGTAEPITQLAVSPTALSLSGGGQQTGQLIALATNGTTGLQEDVTKSPQLTWSSSVDQIATVSASGQVTGVSPGTATITARWANPDASIVSATTTITVSSVSVASSLVSLTIYPSSISVGDLQDSGNFIAIGTFSTPPTVRDLTNSVTWSSSFPDYFPVSSNSGGTQTASGGIVTAYAAGSATIIAEATGPDGGIQTATATFNCPLVLPNPPTTPGSCYQGQFGPLKVTLTIYGEGLNTTNWLITAPSATATPDVIHCGPGWAAGGNSGGSVCTGIYPIGTKLLLTAPAQTGVAFGGWTFNCTPSDSSGNPLPGPDFYSATGPNYCTISLGGTNATVGAIFNNQ